MKPSLFWTPISKTRQILSVVEKIKGIITQTQGEIIKVEDWGKRKLAYNVKKKAQGHYYPHLLLGSPVLVSELERNFRVMDAVIKFQSVRLERNTILPRRPSFLKNPQRRSLQKQA